MFYDNFLKACAKRGTTITQLLRDIHRSEGNTGTWKVGRYPKLDLVLEMAEHLHMSLDEFVYGDEAPFTAAHDAQETQKIELSQSDMEWLEIIHRIPDERQVMCMDFLKTHMALPERNIDKMDA